MQCVVFIDLDGFKDVNDNYGHDVGDALIRHIASALQKRVPAEAMLARMGGDEFAMAVSGEQAIDRAAAFAWAALELLKAPVALSKRKIYIGASIGIASGTPAECSSTELFRRADIAMYHAKKSGKGQTAWYDDALDAVRRHQLMIENGIRQGLEQDEFEVWYQPVVDADTLTMTGVEALLRWPRRPQGALAPDAFIAIAESSGLIDTLGQFVLQRACSDLQPVSDLLLSVNISPAQFRDPAFESRVMETVAACRFPPSRLQVEVTESYVLENPERSQAVVENLKAQGIAVALDDFGTGYSSIGYLRRFRFDSLKIDKSLAGRVDCDAQAAEMVRGTVRIARALGMTVVAEGLKIRNSWRCCGGPVATGYRAFTSVNRCRSPTCCSGASSRGNYSPASASSLSRKPVTAMARLSARQRSCGPGAELCTAITCQPSAVFSSSGEPLSPGRVSHWCDRTLFCAQPVTMQSWWL